MDKPFKSTESGAKRSMATDEMAAHNIRAFAQRLAVQVGKGTKDPQGDGTNHLDG